MTSITARLSKMRDTIAEHGFLVEGASMNQWKSPPPAACWTSSGTQNPLGVARCVQYRNHGKISEPHIWRV